MVPAHDDADHLDQALESVLAQGLPPDTQIEVVDDCSTDATPDVARRHRDAGVGLHRHRVRRGAVGAFNTCLERARGHYVHVLHADDLVLPGFHRRMGAALDRDMVAAVCRTAYLRYGDTLRVTRSEGRTGPWTDVRTTLAVSNRIRPPGIVFRRSAVVAVGGFRPDLGHAADWELWARLAAHGSVWFEDEVLAAYRVRPGSDTSRWRRRADNVRERVVVLGEVSDRLDPGRARWRRRQGLGYGAAFAGRTAWSYVRQRRWSAARAQAAAAGACLAGAVVAPGIATRLLAAGR